MYIIMYHVSIGLIPVQLDNNLEPVIADFGLSKILQDQLTIPVSCMVGTCQWMAPELLDTDLLSPRLQNNSTTATAKQKSPAPMYSAKVDVYSYGVVLWEILSGQLPYANFANQFQANSVS
jgi:serine/threonine protein kinase